jgi:hypothetical protein
MLEIDIIFLSGLVLVVAIGIIMYGKLREVNK